MFSTLVAKRFFVEENNRLIVVCLHPAKLIRSGADCRNRHLRVHDDLKAERDVMRRDRLAIGPSEVVSHHDLVHQPIFAGLPCLDAVAAGGVIHLPIGAKQPKACQAGDLEFSDRADHQRIGAFGIAADVTIDDGLEVGLFVICRQPAQGAEDLGIGFRRGVLELERRGDADQRRRLFLLFAQFGRKVDDRLIEPTGRLVQFGQRRRIVGL